MAAPHELDTMSRIIRDWLSYQKESRDREGLETTDDTFFVCMDMPQHPTRGMFEAWALAIEQARDDLARLT